MNNPYQPPTSVDSPGIPISFGESPRYLAGLLMIFAVVIGSISLRPFLLGPIARWGWQNWVFGFAPGAYLLVGSAYALLAETRKTNRPRMYLPIVMLPGFLLTFLICWVIWIDFTATISGKYDASQVAYTLLLASLCPVLWTYYVLVVLRWSSSMRHRSR